MCGKIVIIKRSQLCKGKNLGPLRGCFGRTKIALHGLVNLHLGLSTVDGKKSCTTWDVKKYGFYTCIPRAFGASQVFFDFFSINRMSEVYRNGWGVQEYDQIHT